MTNEEECPCKSGRPFGECCGPIIAGKAKAETAEALMRARYSCYVTGEVEFLRTSATKTVQDEFDMDAARGWSQAATWHGLEILHTEKGGAKDDEGVVEFRALYSAQNEFCNHHEVSQFRREGGEWKFVDGEIVADRPIVREHPKIGRNDPCPCGSGKKYKKCCGKNAKD